MKECLVNDEFNQTIPKGKNEHLIIIERRNFVVKVKYDVSIIHIFRHKLNTTFYIFRGRYELLTWCSLY